eukprot:TRINITY_DN62076_c0_g1_i1.p1 TRINITY_DN62076_c0_g1~~TRINITY_DN62076_c0_g1_i1.p1  ORF type:complete len:256 (+),score=4.28 TRINITY_DN62076_c0_g1_i1:38-805(+)
MRSSKYIRKVLTRPNNMKNSTIMIISAIAIILISLTAYNFNLRASYRNGDYKNPFYGLYYNPIRNVSKIELNCSNNIQCQIRQGKKNGVYLSERAKDKVCWSIENGILKVGLTDVARKSDFMVYNDDMIIVLPGLEQFEAKPHFSSEALQQAGRSYGKAIISGFIQDSMLVNIGVSSSAVLDSLRVGKLNVSIGQNGKSHSHLSLNSGTFGTAVFKIPGSGSLELLDPQITKTEYHISREATVSLNGKPLQAIEK